MGAPSTGAKSLECCGRAGEHQQQQHHQDQHHPGEEEEGRHHHQVAARQLQHFQDHENNNFPNFRENILIHNFNNNHIYVNPNEYSYFTVIDERPDQINNNSTRRSTVTTLATLQTQLDKEETSFTKKAKNQKRKFLRREKSKDKEKDKKKSKLPTTYPDKKEKKEKKKQSSSGIPPAARARSQGRGMEDPLTQRPRRKLAAKPEQQPPQEK